MQLQSHAFDTLRMPVKVNTEHYNKLVNSVVCKRHLCPAMNQLCMSYISQDPKTAFSGLVCTCLKLEGSADVS